MARLKIKKVGICLTLAILVLSIAPAAFPDSYTFTAGQVKTWMNDAGAPLSDAQYYYGLWAVRTIPEVTGGGFTITGGSTNQTGWGVTAPSTYSWNTYTTNCAWFWDAAGAEAGYPANPLYMIINQSAGDFTSYLGNTVTAVDDSSTFTVDFTLGSGATWTGGFYFLVDGSKYYAEGGLPAEWAEDFFGDYSTYNWQTGLDELGGGLANNSDLGYQVPLPPSVLLLGSGLLGLAALGRRKVWKA